MPAVILTVQMSWLRPQKRPLSTVATGPAILTVQLAWRRPQKRPLSTVATGLNPDGAVGSATAQKTAVIRRSYGRRNPDGAVNWLQSQQRLLWSVAVLVPILTVYLVWLQPSPAAEPHKRGKRPRRGYRAATATPFSSREYTHMYILDRVLSDSI